MAGQPARRPRDDQRRGGRGQRNDGRRRQHGRRQNAQTSDLPIISELLKPGQEILVQIAKEPIAKKGARITSHIALPGRFLVFMPTVNHVGCLAQDRVRRRAPPPEGDPAQRKGRGHAAASSSAPRPMGASEEELRSDLRFLLNLWADIKQRSDTAQVAGADLSRSQPGRAHSARPGHATTSPPSGSTPRPSTSASLRFLQRFQPSLIRRVKLYTKETPLFEQFGITEEINKALRVQGLAQVRRIDCHQPDRSPGRDRHQHRQVCRQDGAPRRHHRQDQPRCHPGDRAPDSAARSGRHHHHRLHRHGRAQEPQQGHGRRSKKS